MWRGPDTARRCTAPRVQANRAGLAAIGAHVATSRQTRPHTGTRRTSSRVPGTGMITWLVQACARSPPGGASVARARHSVGDGPGDGAHGDQTRSEDDTNTRAGRGLTNAQRGPWVGGDVRRRRARSACAPTEKLDMRHARKIFQQFFLTPCGWNRLQAEALGRAPRGERPYGITTRRRPVCR